MGQMIDGAWVRENHLAATVDGAFQRPPTTFHDAIAPGGNIPAAGRALPPLRLARLPVGAPHPDHARAEAAGARSRRLRGQRLFMGEDGWTFLPGDGVVADPAMGANLPAPALFPAPIRTTPAGLRCRCCGTRPRQRSSTTNPPKKSCASSMPRSTASTRAPGDYYPAALRPEIHAVNERVDATLNNGVDRAGFASTQDAYEAAVAAAVRHARLAGGAARAAAVPRRRAVHRGRHPGCSPR